MAGNPWDCYYDELTTGEQETSMARTITEADVIAYANVTGCWFPLHTDAEFAAETRFGQPVVQGTYLLGLAEGLLFRNGPSGIRANAGMEDIEFRRPAFVGDTVRFRVTVLEKEPREDSGGYVTVRIEGINENDEVLVSYTNRLLMVSSE